MEIQSRIEQKLSASFAPAQLEVLNESHGHNVPKGSETHFKIVLVSDSFEGLGLVARHRKVYQVLGDELQLGVHALALHTYTPQEWSAREGSSPDSPRCHGGGVKK